MDQSSSNGSNNSRSSGGRGANGGQGSGARNKSNKNNRRSAAAKKGGGSGSSNGRSSDSRANGKDDQRSGSSRRRKGARKKRVDPLAFWGDPQKLPPENTDPALITTNPSAVVQSLGRAPLAGQQNAADLYFAAIYDRSVNLAAALAAAGGLVEADEIA